MGTPFANGWLIDIVIAMTLLEGICIGLYHCLTHRGVSPRDYALNLFSGLCLMLALRSALANASWPWVAAWLATAGLAHAADLWRRWAR